MTKNMSDDADGRDRFALCLGLPSVGKLGFLEGLFDLFDNRVYRSKFVAKATVIPIDGFRLLNHGARSLEFTERLDKRLFCLLCLHLFSEIEQALHRLDGKVLRDGLVDKA